jgi:hypothetical protein
MIMGAVLSVAVMAALGTSGCGASESNTPKAAEGRAPRDREAHQAFEQAKRAGWLAAYESVVKRYEGTDAADLAKIEIARQSAGLARIAVGRGDWDEARAMSKRALEMGDSTIAQEARSTLAQVDHADALETTERVAAVLEKDATIEGCFKAIRVVAETLGPEPSKTFERDLRKGTVNPIAACTRIAIDEAGKDGSYAPVRKALESEEAKQALGVDSQFSLLSALNDKVVEAMVAAVDADMKAGRWKETFEGLEAWGKDSRAGVQQVEAAKKKARDTITTDVLRRGKQALGARKPEPTLADLDRALAVFGTMNVSTELPTLRLHLATWVECSRLVCRPEPKPGLVYNFGSTSLLPVTSAQGAATTKIPHGTMLWILARGRGFNLVSQQDPGELATWAERLAAAHGWVEAGILKTQDTSAWVPVGPALVGERVWLPTGRDDKLYQLGVVEAVDGQSVTVKKIADGLSTTVKRTDVRSGLLAAGTKVLAFCRDTLKQTEARMESVDRSDARAPRAKVTCLKEDGTDDRAHEEVLGALRAEVSWLPALRP